MGLAELGTLLIQGTGQRLAGVWEQPVLYVHDLPLNQRGLAPWTQDWS